MNNLAASIGVEGMSRREGCLKVAAVVVRMRGCRWEVVCVLAPGKCSNGTDN